MRKIATLLSLIVAMATSNAQTLIVEYSETMDLSKKLQAIEDPALRKLVIAKTSKPRSYELISCKAASIYREIQNENGANEDGEDVNVTIQNGDIIYKNHKEKLFIRQANFLSRVFLIKDKLPKMEWKITNESLKIHDYICKKAVVEIKNDTIEAWFAEDIPSKEGPKHYYGLPGLIMKVKEKDNIIEAVKISPIREDTAISPPTKGRKITQEKFNKIVKEKTENLSGGKTSGGVKVITM